MGTLRESLIKVLRERYYRENPDSPEVPLSVIWEDFERRCLAANKRKKEQEERRRKDEKYRRI